MSTYRRIWPHQTIEEYGMNGGRFIPQPGSVSGFLLDFGAIDEHAWAVNHHAPSRYVVIGETIRDDGVRTPELMRLRS
jgi:hypothetical protein